MDPEDITIPGDIAAGGSADTLPLDAGAVDNPNLSFQPSLDNLLPTNSMPDSLLSSIENQNSTGLLSQAAGGVGNALDTTSADPLTSSLLGFGENLGTSLANAFLINPQNAATAEGQATASAGITSILSSQYFGYALIILVVLGVIGFFDKK